MFNECLARRRLHGNWDDRQFWTDRQQDVMNVLQPLAGWMLRRPAAQAELPPARCRDTPQSRAAEAARISEQRQIPDCLRIKVVAGQNGLGI
jgi:hypothetical protein